MTEREWRQNEIAKHSRKMIEEGKITEEVIAQIEELADIYADYVTGSIDLPEMQPKKNIK